jgi:N-methylhydantoinase B
VAVAEGTLLADVTQGGGGYGDPLEREPALVAADVRRRSVSRRAADVIFGVILGPDREPDEAATAARRAAIRQERRSESPPPAPPDAASSSGPGNAPALHFHETLELVGSGAAAHVRCRRCGQGLGPRTATYKRHALRRDRDLAELSGRPMPDGSAYRAVLREYACPGCATLLQVDVWCPELGGAEDLADIEIER